MTDPIERIAVVLEAADQRMSAMDLRFVRMEGHLADDAQATARQPRQAAAERGGAAAAQGDTGLPGPSDWRGSR